LLSLNQKRKKLREKSRNIAAAFGGRFGNFGEDEGKG
jgi:hypothetical protein